jgi:hypothetical protein
MVLTHNKEKAFTGFLGNRLFQWSSCVGIAVKNGMHYAFPYHEYMDYFKGDFHVDNNIADLPTVDYTEPNFYYDEVVLQKDLNYNLSGYYQSETYFKHCEPLIRQLFEFNDDIKKYISEKYLLHLKSKGDVFVAVSVRRGDYLQYPDHHTVLPLEYFTKSALFLEDAIGVSKENIIYVVFSDDHNWCKDNFIDHPIFKDRVVFAEGNNQGQDLYYMSQCNHFIMSPSTMIFWGSWLSQSKDKITICCPKDKWFGKARQTKEWSVEDLYMEDWILI